METVLTFGKLSTTKLTTLHVRKNVPTFIWPPCTIVHTNNNPDICCIKFFSSITISQAGLAHIDLQLC
jgi:hypothetical protein